MKLQHLVEAQQFDAETLFGLFDRADDFRIRREQPPGGATAPERPLDGKFLATLFYEPSTRTRFSFEIAMHRLGGGMVSTENAAEFSSAVKGESLEDSVRVVGGYVDGIVLRHTEEGAARRAAAVSDVPVINAGDGAGQHPTQALTDVYTIWREFGQLEGMYVAMVGDLKHGRTVRSLAYLLGKFSGTRIAFVAPPSLQIGGDITGYLQRHGVPYAQTDRLDPVLREADIVYMTRLQKERMPPGEAEQGNGGYRITEENLELVSRTARLLHPLPKNKEIILPVEVERTDPRVAYFRQSGNGMYARMALLENMLGD